MMPVEDTRQPITQEVTREIIVEVTTTPPAAQPTPEPVIQTQEATREVTREAEVLVVATATPEPPAPTAIPSPTAVLELPFLDSFDSGPRSEWRPISGDWRMVNGQYTATGSDSEWVYSVVGDPNWQDYVIETDYSIEGYDKVAILVRAGGTSALGLSFRLRWGEVSWLIWQEGDWSTLASGELKHSTGSGRMRIEVRGSTFTGSIDGLSQLTVTDNSSTTGYVGVGIYCRGGANCPIFDNFQITRIGE